MKKNYRRRIVMLIAIFTFIVLPLKAQAELPQDEPLIENEIKEILVNDKVEDFKWKMRMLWFDHGVWMRNTIVADIEGQNDANLVFERLLKNSEDIGNEFRLWYGNIPADELTRLLKEHITLATQVINAQKNQNTVSLRENKDKWYKNAESMALFLSDLSYQMDYIELRKIFDDQLDMILTVADYRLNNDLATEINSYDELMAHMMKISDYIATAIVEQFPQEFK